MANENNKAKGIGLIILAVLILGLMSYMIIAGKHIGIKNPWKLFKTGIHSMTSCTSVQNYIAPGNISNGTARTTIDGKNVEEHVFAAEELNAFNLSLISEDVIVRESTDGNVGVKIVYRDGAVIPQVSVNNKTLIIQHTEGRIYKASDAVYLYVPEGINAEISLTTVSGDIDVNLAQKSGDWVAKTVSGDVLINGLDAHEGKVRTTSGDVNILNVTATNISDESVSGSITASGTIKNFNARTTSGDVNFLPKNTPEDGTISTVSGNVSIKPAAGFGVALDYSTISGTVRASRNGHQKNGGARSGQIISEFTSEKMTVKTTSGNIIVE